ncbi:MAG: GlxA family transcriptional regulator [Burkholderiaceae bacterium]
MATAFATACSISRCELTPTTFRNLRILRLNVSSSIRVSRLVLPERFAQMLCERREHHVASATLQYHWRMRPTPAYMVGFYLLAGFPMMAFASAIEPLRAANRLSGEALFDWRLFSRDGEPVRASNGIDIAVHGSIRDAPVLDLLLVCAGLHEAQLDDQPTHQWLRGLTRRGIAIGSISIGAYVLAYAGLLDGRRCALHWESLAAFAERFPRVRTTSEIFVIDGDRSTCSGGTAALDMMLQVITNRDGRTLANDVAEQFIHPRIRGTQDPQRMAIQSRLGVANEKLIAAIAMMEATHDELRPVQEIADVVELSARQLERLFAKYLRSSPSRFYLKVRLDRARAMLLQTTKPILDVAAACGFTSASHFSRCYRTAYGHKPSDERAASLAVGIAAPQSRTPKPLARGQRARAAQ